MKLLKKNTIEVKKSKFIAYAYEVTTKEEVETIITSLKKEHKKARHFPYTYKIGNLIRKTDDKEPANTAGTPIYNIIEHKKLDNILIVVVRYFGGIKLGAGGLFRAYSTAANEVIKEG